MKKVNYDDYIKELEKVRRELIEEINSIDIEIHEKDYTSKIVNLGVNWASKGTVGVYEAIKFAKDIQKAIELVNNFKYNGMEIV